MLLADDPGAWMTRRFGPAIPLPAFAAVSVAVQWLIVRAMDHRRIHLKR